MGKTQTADEKEQALRELMREANGVAKDIRSALAEARVGVAEMNETIIEAARRKTAILEASAESAAEDLATVTRAMEAHVTEAGQVQVLRLERMIDRMAKHIAVVMEGETPQQISDRVLGKITDQIITALSGRMDEAAKMVLRAELPTLMREVIHERQGTPGPLLKALTTNQSLEHMFESMGDSPAGH